MENPENQDKSAKVGLWILAVLLLVLLASFLTPYIQDYIYFVQPYAAAKRLLESERYAEALIQLEKVKKPDYEDTEGMISLCEAHKKYEEGDLAGAYYTLYDAEFYHQSREQYRKIGVFRDMLREEYEAAVNAEVGKKSADAEEQQQETERSAFPFEGMREEDIANTKLGAPSPDVRQTTEVLDGVQQEVTIYNFKNGGYTYFVARCVGGTVTKVWDYRNRPEPPPTPSPKPTAPKYAGGTTNKSKKATTDKGKKDKYNAKNYSTPEDFYEDYYDDFDDYDEAEMYYEEHGE